MFNVQDRLLRHWGLFVTIDLFLWIKEILKALWRGLDVSFTQGHRLDTSGSKKWQEMQRSLHPIRDLWSETFIMDDPNIINQCPSWVLEFVPTLPLVDWSEKQTISQLWKRLFCSFTSKYFIPIRLTHYIQVGDQGRSSQVYQPFLLFYPPGHGNLLLLNHQ